jgi:hypothetical protein
MHPLAGNADWDESYKRANSKEMYKRDKKVYDKIRKELPILIRRLKTDLNI